MLNYGRVAEPFAEVSWKGGEWHTRAGFLQLAGHVEVPLVCFEPLVCTCTWCRLWLFWLFLGSSHTYCRVNHAISGEVVLEQSYKICQNYEFMEGW